jgi:hypothetical protein
LHGGTSRFAGRRRRGAFAIAWHHRCRAPACALAGAFANTSAQANSGPAMRGTTGSIWSDASKTRGAAERCQLQTAKQNLSVYFGSYIFSTGSSLRERPTPACPAYRGVKSAPPNDPWSVQYGGRVELILCPSRPEPPSVLRVRADRGCRLFTAKLGVVVHYLPHQGWPLRAPSRISPRS